MVSTYVQRGQKNFRLDIFARRIIMKIARDAATSGRPKEISLVEKTQENRHLAEWRFSRFFIIIVTVKEPICKVIRMVSPPFGWCGRPPAVCAASLKTIVPYRTKKSSPPGREGLLRLRSYLLNLVKSMTCAMSIKSSTRSWGVRSSDWYGTKGTCGSAFFMSSPPPLLRRRTGAGHTSVQPKRKNSKIDNKPLRFCAIISTNISPKEMPLLWQRNNSRQNPSVCST